MLCGFDDLGEQQQRPRKSPQASVGLSLLWNRFWEKRRERLYYPTVSFPRFRSAEEGREGLGSEPIAPQTSQKETWPE